MMKHQGKTDREKKAGLQWGFRIDGEAPSLVFAWRVCSDMACDQLGLADDRFA